MVEKIELFKDTDQWQKEGGQYIPNPATWLNQNRWEDEIKIEIKEVPKYLKGLKKAWEADQNGKEPVLLPHGKINNSI